jgi:hypothetical protein
MSNWGYVGLAYGLTWGVLIVYALSIVSRTGRLQSELKS